MRWCEGVKWRTRTRTSIQTKLATSFFLLKEAPPFAWEALWGEETRTYAATPSSRPPNTGHNIVFALRCLTWLDDVFNQLVGANRYCQG